MCAKLGIAAPREGDDELISQLYGLLDANRSDYTLFFRQLGRLPASPQGRRRTRRCATSSSTAKPATPGSPPGANGCAANRGPTGSASRR